MMTMAQQSSLGVNDFRDINVTADEVARKLNLNDVDSDTNENTINIPTVRELFQEVAKLQETLRQMAKHDAIRCGELNDPSMLAASRESSPLRHRFADVRSTLKQHSSSPELRFRETTPTKLVGGIYGSRRSSVSSLSPEKDDVRSRSDLNLRASFTGGLTTPPKRMSDSFYASIARAPSTAPHPTRVAALTKENISLLPAPTDFRRRHNFNGSVCGSQKSKSSVRTDGGAVFSRLYQPDFYKNRDAKLRALRDRQESLMGFKVRRRPSCGSSRDGDSIESGSIASSMQSARTNVSQVSSRLYDPDYLRKRNARLEKMRQEQELRQCTFKPSIHAAPRRSSSRR